jgi:hypothetical protein
MQTGYSVTDVREGGIKLEQFRNQASLHLTIVLLKEGLQITVTSLVHTLTRPIRQECAFHIFDKTFLNFKTTSLVVWWSELLTTNHEVPGSIPASTMGIFLEGGGSPW